MRVVVPWIWLVGCALERPALSLVEAVDSGGPRDVGVTGDAEPAEDATMDAGPDDVTSPGDVGPTEDACSPERCDGADNDCDGAVDEADPRGLGSRCTLGAMGTCTGMLICDGVGLVCQPNDVRAESCNGLDDDCDNALDEEVATVGDACRVGVAGARGDDLVRADDGPRVPAQSRRSRDGTLRLRGQRLRQPRRREPASPE